ncbi:MAG: ABC transporter ATP-binding protein, partial [Desulfobacterales bacterium]|nr:ABC transporter ATP-binding protein [Desulfobacterales bacterium]
ATASLDPENERLIQSALSQLVRSKTLIVIAHRLRTIARADNILVIDRGEVAEQGSHDRLLVRGGIYAGLWQHQQEASGWKFGNMGQAVM